MQALCSTHAGQVERSQFWSQDALCECGLTLSTWRCGAAAPSSAEAIDARLAPLAGIFDNQPGCL